MDVATSRETYIAYIDEHRNNVRRAWEIVSEHCSNMRFNRYGIRELCEYNVENHDESKYRPEEFEAYRKWWYPADGEVPDKALQDKAWELHKQLNGHHWQNWTTNEELSLPERDAYFIEMVCDWMAMSMKFGGTVREWFTTNDEGVVLPTPYTNYLYRILDDVEPHMRGEGRYGLARSNER